MRKRSDKNKELHDREIALMKEMWNKYPHISEQSGEPLGNTFNVCFFSHVLGKQSYPAFRLLPKNLVIISFEEHQLWEFYKHEIKDDPAWQWMFELEAYLKRIYHTNYNSILLKRAMTNEKETIDHKILGS